MFILFVSAFLNHFPILVQTVPFLIMDFTFLNFIRNDPQEEVSVRETSSLTPSEGFLELAKPSPVIPEAAIALAAAESTCNSYIYMIRLTDILKSIVMMMMIVLRKNINERPIYLHKLTHLTTCFRDTGSSSKQRGRRRKQHSQKGLQLSWCNRYDFNHCCTGRRTKTSERGCEW